MKKRKVQLKKARKWRWNWIVDQGDTRSLLYRIEYNGRYAKV